MSLPLTDAKQQLLRQRRLGRAANHAPAAEARPARIPLSFEQQQLWFVDRLAGAAAGYNVTARLNIAGALDVAAVNAAVQQILARHEILRTSFPEADGSPFQLIRPELRIEIPYIDLRGCSPHDRREQVGQLLDRERTMPFDLANGPIIRATLMTLAPDQHVLVRTIHHIACDATSNRIFAREFHACYDAAVKGRTPELPPIGLQAADYAVRQRRTLSADALDRSLDYWRRALESCPEDPALPADRARPKRMAGTGDLRLMVLSSALSDGVRRLAREQQMTPFGLLFGVFGVLLMRQSGGTDLVIGSPMANRSDPAIESTIGFFVNTLPLRLRIHAWDSFTRVFQQARDTILTAHEHADAPFDQIVNAVRRQRRSNETPLFQVLFGMLDDVATTAVREEARKELGGVTSVAIAGAHPIRFDLELYAETRDDRIALSWLYRPDLFEADTIAELMRLFVDLTEAACSDPQRRVGTVGAVDDGVRPPTAADGAVTNIVERFETQARRTPDATALMCRNERRTYAETQAAIDRLARRLIAAGVHETSIVGICLPRSGDVVVAALAAMKVGAAFVPIDPACPELRLAALLESARPAVVIVNPDSRQRLAAQKTVMLDEGVGDEIDAAPFVQRSIRPDQPAYVLYTSGSTGTPKGVVIPHRALSTFAEGIHRVVPFQPADRHLAVTTTTFDISILELLVPLTHGAAVVIAAEDEMRDPGALAALVQRHGATVLQATPSLWRVLVQHDPGAWGSLRALVGGEPLPNVVASALLEAASCAVNLYGPTEATIWASSHLISAADVGPSAESVVTIGQALEGYQLHVLDGLLAPVRAGARGELYISGPALAIGYLGQSRLTAERFVADPRGSSGARMYRTGDLARLAADGRIHFLGRADDQVKLRGFRIELGEIAAAARACRGVGDALAAVVGNDDPQLVLYVLRDRISQAADSGVDGERLAAWQAVYDTAYQRGRAEDPAFDTRDWISSYTSAPIPAEEMRDWLDATLAEIRRQSGMQAVLEIGCGTGLLLTRLAPSCSRYVGIDFSATAIQRLKQVCSDRPDLSHVDVRVAAAHELSFVEDESVDTVIINSVIQYFPGADYLLKVLSETLRVTRTGGRIFVGDVRNANLSRAFHVSVELERGGAALPASELAARADRAVRNDGELLVAPAFFRELAAACPRLASAHVLPKRGRLDSEMHRFRYDVALSVGDRTSLSPADRRVTWDADGRWRGTVTSLLAAEPSLSILVERVPDRRAAGAAAAARRLWRGEQAWPVETAGEDLRLVDALGSSVEWLGADVDGCSDVVINPRRVPAESSAALDAPLSRFVTAPDLDDEAFSRRIREELSLRLPDYMVPARVMRLDAWPLTPAGKVDRRALPAVSVARSLRRGRAARNEQERLLCAVFAELLRVDHVAADDDFFELGGHSLIAMRVIARIHELFGVAVPIAAFLDRPTPERLAEQLAAPAPDAGDVPLEPVARGADVPLSFNQQRYLLELWRLGKARPAPFQINFEVPLPDAGDPVLVERVMIELLNRHEVLRTAFLPRPGISAAKPFAAIAMRLLRRRFVQRLVRSALSRRQAPGFFRGELRHIPGVRIRSIDVTGLDGARRVATIARQRELTAPFDVQRPPHVRAVLATAQGRPGVLALAISHVVCDWWSAGVFRDEFLAIYTAFAQGRPSPLPAPVLQFADVALWERRRFTGPSLERAMAFWRKFVPGFSPFSTPFNVSALTYARPARPRTYRVRFLVVDLDVETYAAIRQAAADRHATVYMFLLASVAALFRLTSNEKEEAITLWGLFANRQLPQTHQLIGWMYVILPLRFDVVRGLTFERLLACSRDAVLGAMAHPIPIELLALQNDLNLSANAIENMAHVHIDVREMRDDVIDDAASRPAMEFREREGPALALMCLQGRTRFKIVAQYSIDWFEDARVRALFDDLQQLMHAAARRPGATIESLGRAVSDVRQRASGDRDAQSETQ
ncbi:MAG TPA: amino acid adenylation domain-containing protein [Vicinamibacterales bacterium]|nr:amino acid adenylation domain-containing protein [Vicinamibacterales bacterium]